MLLARKLAKVEEMVGKSKEEENPEGRLVVGPSGEAVVNSSGIAPPFLFSINYFINCSILPFAVAYSFIIRWISILNFAFLSYLGSSCSQMSPMKRVKWWWRPRRSRIWGLCRVAWRWGASQLCLRRRHGGCCVRYFPPSNSSVCLYFSQSSHLSLILVIDARA